MASRFVFFPVLVLLHEDLVFARLHLRVVLDGAARLDQQLVDAPEREKEGRRYKSFSIVSIVPRVTRRRRRQGFHPPLTTTANASAKADRHCDTTSSSLRARCPSALPIVEVVSGEHGAVCGVEVEPPDAVGVQQVHETARERRSAGCRT